MIVIRACPAHDDAVDVCDSKGGGDGEPPAQIHLPAAEWQEFRDAVKAGKYDVVTRTEQAMAVRRAAGRTPKGDT